MGITKLLVFLLVAGFVWWSYRRLQSYKYKRLQRQNQRAKQQQKMMLPCAHCGLHVPASEVVKFNGKDYCCPEHASKGPR